MKKRAFSVLIAWLFLIGTAWAATYNPTLDFSLANGNPNGVWTYGAVNNDLTDFNLLTDTYTADGLMVWHKIMFTQSARIVLNYTSQTHAGVGPGLLALSEGWMGSGVYQEPVLRFTAPAAGYYDIEGEFFANNSPRIGVRKNGETDWAAFLWSGYNYGTFNLADTYLAQDDTIDFVVHGGWSGPPTPLDVTISTSAVPVPSSIILLCLGLTGFAGFRARKRT